MPSDAGAAGALELLRPDWPASRTVVAAMSTRRGGVGRRPFDSLNLRPFELQGSVQDEPAAVLQNQELFATALGARPVWLNQVHGAEVVRLGAMGTDSTGPFPRADAAVTTEPGVACAVLVADCLPVLFCSADERVVGAAHAGWRGLAAGVLENTVAAMGEAGGCEPGEVSTWLGACIGPGHFEVGADVLEAFGVEPHDRTAPRFVYRPRPDGAPRWLADLAGLARDRLERVGVRRISGGGWCTVQDASRFFSFRRDGLTGRMAAAIGLRGV